MNLFLVFISSSEFVVNNRLINFFDVNLFLFEVFRMINFYKKYKN